jgi:hypothetical protein
MMTEELRQFIVANFNRVRFDEKASVSVDVDIYEVKLRLGF